MLKTLKNILGLGHRVQEGHTENVERIVDHTNAVLKAFGKQATMAGNHFVIEQAIAGNDPVDTGILMISQTTSLNTYDLDNMLSLNDQEMVLLEGLKEYKDRGIVDEEQWKALTTTVHSVYTPQQQSEEIANFLIKLGGSKPLVWDIPE